MPPNTQSHKILFIENDAAIIDALKTRLAPLGVEVFLAEDQTKSLDELSRIHPDLVVLDVGIPNVDGFAILEAIRAHADTTLAHVPVLIASNTGDLVEIARALKLDIKDYFVKSGFDPDRAAQKIASYLPQIAATGAGTPSPAQTPGIPKLLIVEDDKFLRDLAAQKLMKENLQVSTAVDGEQGIAIAEKEIPDIILLDILLPGIDGFEVLSRIRANAQFAHTHVVMLSNFGQREDIEKALHAGANQFFIKANYTLDEIVEEVKKITTAPHA